jgi:RecA/RadA recombinase
MVPAKKLGLAQETCEGFLTYYNLELAGGANMVVAGVAVESLAPVRRMVVPRAVFEKLIATKYSGHSAAEIAKMVARTCRTLDGDRVEIPVVRK